MHIGKKEKIQVNETLRRNLSSTHRPGPARTPRPVGTVNRQHNRGTRTGRSRVSFVEMSSKEEGKEPSSSSTQRDDGRDLGHEAKPQKTRRAAVIVEVRAAESRGGYTESAATARRRQLRKSGSTGSSNRNKRRPLGRLFVTYVASGGRLKDRQQSRSPLGSVPKLCVHSAITNRGKHIRLLRA